MGVNKMEMSLIIERDEAKQDNTRTGKLVIRCAFQTVMNKDVLNALYNGMVDAVAKCFIRCYYMTLLLI